MSQTKIKYSSMENNYSNNKNISSRNVSISNKNISKSININNEMKEKIEKLPKLSNNYLNNNVNLKKSFSTKKIFYCQKKEKEMALLKQKKLLEKNLLNRIYFKEIDKILAKKKTKDIDESNNMDLFNRDLNYNLNSNEFNNNNNNKLKKIFSYDNIKNKKLPIISNEDKNNFINNFNKVSIFESQKNFLKKHQPIEHKYLHLRNLTKFNNNVFKKKQFDINNQHKNILSSPNVYY